MSEKLVSGFFRVSAAEGIPANIEAGQVLPADVYQKALNEHLAKLELNISDPSQVRAFIDQPIFTGPIPHEPDKQQELVSRLIHEYRQANPAVIHAAGIIANEGLTDLTDLYYQCQSSFNWMIRDIINNKVVKEDIQYLQWEYISFPRMVKSIEQLFSILIIIEYDDINPAIITHSVMLYKSNAANVYSSRINIGMTTT